MGKRCERLDLSTADPSSFLFFLFLFFRCFVLFFFLFLAQFRDLLARGARLSPGLSAPDALANLASV